MRPVMTPEKANSGMNANLGNVVHIIFNLVIKVSIEAISWSSHYNYMIILSEVFTEDQLQAVHPLAVILHRSNEKTEAHCLSCSSHVTSVPKERDPSISVRDSVQARRVAQAIQFWVHYVQAYR
jgi:hypothetical protein